MRTILALVALTSPALADDPIRYVAAQKGGAGWTVWTNGGGPNACAVAMLAASRHKQKGGRPDL